MSDENKQETFPFFGKECTSSGGSRVWVGQCSSKHPYGAHIAMRLTNTEGKSETITMSFEVACLLATLILTNSAGAAYSPPDAGIQKSSNSSKKF